MHPAPFLAYFVREELAALPNGQTSQNRGLAPFLGFIGASDRVHLHLRQSSRTAEAQL